MDTIQKTLDRIDNKQYLTHLQERELDQGFLNIYLAYRYSAETQDNLRIIMGLTRESIKGIPVQEASDPTEAFEFNGSPLNYRRKDDQAMWGPGFSPYSDTIEIPEAFLPEGCYSVRNAQKWMYGPTITNVARNIINTGTLENFRNLRGQVVKLEEVIRESNKQSREAQKSRVTAMSEASESMSRLFQGSQ